MNIRRPRIALAVMGVVAALAAGVLVGAPGAQAAGTGPCDIYASGGTPCVAAHSTTRALYGAYNGSLYQVKRDSDSSTLNIGPLAAGGIANAAAQDTFCAGTTCRITVIYDQSGRGNHLTQAPPGGFNGPAAGGYDNLAIATSAPVTVGGHKAYGVFINPGTGYRDNSTNGIATGDQAEGMYAVLDGTHYNSGCCFDYGNAETSGLDTGNGHMETVYFGNSTAWGSGTGSGPWLMADLENGLFSGVNRGYNSNDPSVSHRFLTAIVKGEPNHWSLRAGNAQSGGLSTYYNGVRPNVSGYNPMHKEGAIILGIGGDNSNSSAGTFYEGVMTSGYPSDATENAVQANITAAGYSFSGGSKQQITNRNSGLCLDDYNFLTDPGAEVRQWTCNGAGVQDWYLTPTGSGYYSISNAHSGLCLDDYNWGTADGAEVRQWTCNGLTAQQWQVVDAGGGYSTLVNRYSGKCLDDYDWITTAGAEVRQWTCNGLAVQQWAIG